MSHCETKSNDKEAYVEALHLLATTVDGAESWLWPCLIEILLDSAYTASVNNEFDWNIWLIFRFNNEVSDIIALLFAGYIRVTRVILFGDKNGEL